MDLMENIRIFKRLTEKQSFSGVAHEMGVSQPTISKAIADLERKLGVPLFRRSSRGLSLTSEGQKLLAMGSPLLDQVDHVLSSVKNERIQLKGQLKISVSLAFARLILIPMFDEFTKLHSELRLNFQLSDGYTNLVEQGIDVAIRHGDLDDSSLRALKIGSSRRALYASTKYIKKFGMPKSLDDLKKHRLLFYNRISDRPVWPLNDFDGKPAPFAFEPYLQSDGSDLMREALLLGAGIALAPTWMMIGPEKDGKVIRLFEKNTTALIPVYLVTPGGTEMTGKQRAFADFLKKQFEGCAELTMRE